jgi:H/ACA ribonucleoprotein complex subunit 4
MVESVAKRGILLLDKPLDLTSMQCVEISKRVLGAGRAGHSGTLDPGATGLMLIAFNEATKAMPVLAGLDKAYEGAMRMHGPFTRNQLSRILSRFTGRITQTPPRRSAVAKRPRKRRILSIELLSIRERDVSFRATCEAGTYMRKLCHDIGEALGAGAHMAGLRRVGIGPFTIEEAVTMEQLRSQGPACLFPLEQALERIGLPRAVARDASLERLRNGVPLDPSELAGKPTKGQFGIYTQKGRLAALARVENGKAMPERVFN